MRRRLILVILLLSAPAGANERAAFFGLWGTQEQCARAMIKPGGSLRAQPFEITESWLQQGTLWCALTWFPVSIRDTGAFASTQALCGEDSQRSYRLDFSYTASDKALVLIWDEALLNGPLMRCPTQ